MMLLRTLSGRRAAPPSPEPVVPALNGNRLCITARNGDRASLWRLLDQGVHVDAPDDVSRSAARSRPYLGLI